VNAYFIDKKLLNPNQNSIGYFLISLKLGRL
jgi:hypothetical protein